MIGTFGGLLLVGFRIQHIFVYLVNSCLFCLSYTWQQAFSVVFLQEASGLKIVMVVLLHAVVVELYVIYLLIYNFGGLSPGEHPG